MPTFAALHLQSLVVAVLLVVISHPCSAQQDLCSGWCGVHNISHPFRLTDSPDNCGDKRYTLSCQNNQLILYLGSAKYYVNSINYNNFTLRVVDVNLRYSSLPPYSLGPNNFSQSTTFNGPYQIYDPHSLAGKYPRFYSPKKLLPKSLLYVSCPNRMDSSGMHVHDGATCMNAHENNYFLYVNEHGSRSILELGLGDACRIEFMYLTSWPVVENGPDNISCTDIRRMLFYGFELTWILGLCKHSSYVEFNASNTPICVPRSGYVWIGGMRWNEVEWNGMI